MPYRNAPDSEREQRLFPLVLSALRTPMLRPGEALVGRAGLARPAVGDQPQPAVHPAPHLDAKAHRPPVAGRDRVAHQRLETAVAIGVGGGGEVGIIWRVRNEDVAPA